MLAIVTNKDDHTADWLILELHARGTPFIRLNTDEYPHEWKVTWRPGHSMLRTPDGVISGSDITAVWWRRPIPPAHNPALAPQVSAWAQREAVQALDGVWNTLQARWVNHPHANRRASNKPLQLATAIGCGLDVPDTLVTNDADELTSFLDAGDATVICKPLTDGRVTDNGRLFTSPIPKTAAHLLGPEPCLFQRRVEKRADVRVTVIGGEIFATIIDSQGAARTQVDWRRSEFGSLPPHRAATLPTEVHEGCLQLVSEFDLQFAAIDFALRPDGGFTFFEVNPNGQWAWIEQTTGQPLRAALADLLTS